MNDNYPPGTANDPRAPYNQPVDDDFTRTVSLSVSFDYSVILPSYANEDWIKKTIEEEVKNIVNKKLSNLDNFIIDDLEIICD